MPPIERADFLRQGTVARLERVKAEGEYLGSRVHGGHQVHLYRMGPAGSAGFFCEVWMRLGLRYVEWVEVAERLDILQEYVHLDLGGA
jgi:hypothetical protein